MKIAKSFAAAAVLAAASFSSAAYADDISHAVTGLAVTGGTDAHFASSFADNNAGNTFSDRFVFSVYSVPSYLDAFVGNIARSADLGLNLQSLSLYAWNGNLIASGTTVSNGAQDLLSLSTEDALAVGNYYLQVNGTVVGNSNASFVGQLALAPVPEPATYGMMLAGLGIILAFKRK